MNAVDRIKVLNRIGDHFQMIIQWHGIKKPSCSESTTQYFNKAMALIELLEIEDCGSTGGYDKGQPPASTLFDRWDWLYRKYDNPEERMYGCNIVSYKDIKLFFE
jgi:hypothetical protein